MPAHVTIYCKHSIAHVTAADLLAALEEADLMTLAESLNLPEGEEAAVRAMRPHLRVTGDNGFFEVHWKPPGMRPLQLSLVGGKTAQAYLAELLEELPEPEDDDAGAHAVIRHLKECTEILDIEMGHPDSQNLGATLAEVIAFHVAEEGDGLVHFYDREWGTPKDWSKNLWTSGQ